MKKLIFVFCSIFSTAAFSQSVVEDTAFIVNTNGVFFTKTVINYSDGSYNERTSRLGDTAEFYQNTMGGFMNRAVDYSRIVTSNIDITKNIGAAIRENNNIVTAVGKSPLDSLTKQAIPHLVDNGANWTLVTPTANVAIVFSVNANGALRYSADGAQARNVTAFGQYVLRLTAYPATGQFLDLFWDEGRRRYASQDGKIIIRKVTVRR